MNEFQLKIQNLPLCKRPSPKTFANGDLVECIEPRGLYSRFNLIKGSKWRVKNCQKGGVELRGFDGLFFDATRFKLVGGDFPVIAKFDKSTFLAKVAA